MTQKQKELITQYFMYQISEHQRALQQYQNNLRFRKVDVTDLNEHIRIIQSLEILIQVSKDISALLSIDFGCDDIEKAEN